MAMQDINEVLNENRFNSADTGLCNTDVQRYALVFSIELIYKLGICV